jgi:hypothetical protein
MEKKEDGQKTKDHTGHVIACLAQQQHESLKSLAPS